MTGSTPNSGERAPLSLFVLELGYLIALVVLFVVYQEDQGFRASFPSTLGPLPTATPWFGAVGAVLVGLTGHFFHYNNWNPSFNRWHIARPLLGAIEGPVGCLLLLAIVDAASKKSPSADPYFYDGVAFVIGFAEATFRELITKVTQVIIGPGTTGSPNGPSTTDPTNSRGPTSGGSPPGS